MSQLYPLFLKLDDRTVLIVGGGRLALQKWRTLDGTDAGVILVAPSICPELAAAARAGRMRLVRRGYRSSDLKSVALVFAATDDPALNHAVCAEAARRGIWANAIDDPAFCDFYTPSVFRREGLTLAFSTGGEFPGVARALRETLEAWLPEEDSALLLELYAIRREMKARGGEAAQRRRNLQFMIEKFKTDYLGFPLSAPGRHDPSAFFGAGAITTPRGVTSEKVRRKSNENIHPTE